MGAFALESPFFVVVVSGEVPMVMVACMWGGGEGLSLWAWRGQR